MNELVIFIDDEITKATPFGRDLKILIEKRCNRQLRFKNTEEEVDDFVKNPKDVKLVLLDRDLSKIRKNSLDILNNLYKKKIPVIILSRHKPTDKPEGVEDFRKLDKRLDYLLKADIDTQDQEKKGFIKNLINRAIDDKENKKLVAAVHCNTGKIEILWKDSPKKVTTDNIVLNYNPDWRTRIEVPVYPQEVILRILYEMGIRNTTEIKVSNVYTPMLTGVLDKKEHDILSGKLEEIKDKKFIPTDLKENIEKTLTLINSKKEIPSVKVKKIISDLTVILKKEPQNVVVEEAVETLNNLATKKIQLPHKFGDALTSFNETVREKTKGLLVGSLLKGTRGSGKDLYKANIDKIKIEGLEIPPLSWQKEIEERLKRLESEIDSIKQYLPPLKKN